MRLFLPFLFLTFGLCLGLASPQSITGKARYVVAQDDPTDPLHLPGLLDSLKDSLTSNVANATNGTDFGHSLDDLGNVALQVFNTTENLWMQYSGDAGIGLLFVFGLLMLLFGFRLLKLTLFLAGFWFGFAILFIFLRQSTSLEYKWCLFSGLGGGLVGGILAVCVLKVGLFALGAFLGFWVASFALSLPVEIDGRKRTLMQELSQPWQFYVIVGATCLVFGLLALCDKVQKFLIILTTSLGGAFCLCCFADNWLQTGFSLAARTILALLAQNKDIYSVQIKPAVIGLLIGCLAICIGGMVFQYWTPSCKRKGGANTSSSSSEKGPSSV
eukprot:EG_transcript_15220